MVLDEDDGAGAVLRVEAAAAVREDERRAARRRGDADAVRGGLRVATLVEVAPGAQHQRVRPAGQTDRAQATAVAGDRGGLEPGDVLCRSVRDRVAQEVRRTAPAGAQDQCDVMAVDAGRVVEDLGRLLGEMRRLLGIVCAHIHEQYRPQRTRSSGPFLCLIRRR